MVDGRKRSGWQKVLRDRRDCVMKKIAIGMIFIALFLTGCSSEAPPEVNSQESNQITEQNTEISTEISKDVEEQTKNEVGEVVNYAGIKQDISLQKKMADELSDRNLELLEALNQLKSTQTKLIQQEQLAGIGQLAAGVAHEINNPLGFVISNFKTLEDYLKMYKKLINEYHDVLNCEEAKSIKRDIERVEAKYDLEFISEDVEGLIFDSEDGLERIEKIVRSLRSFSRIDQLDQFQP